MRVSRGGKRGHAEQLFEIPKTAIIYEHGGKLGPRDRDMVSIPRPQDFRAKQPPRSCALTIEGQAMRFDAPHRSGEQLKRLSRKWRGSEPATMVRRAIRRTLTMRTEFAEANLAVGGICFN